jgi:mono/diheme cytochrome c family protein
MMGGEVTGGQPMIDVPSEYADLTNPFADDADAIVQGETVYAQCAGCHGANGEGTAISDPPPTAFNLDQSAWSDGYLFWRLREGGASGPSGSIMPAYPESSLSDDQVWQVISYLCSLEP